MYPNKIRISNGEGQVSITAISRAFEVGQVAEDFDLSKYTSVEHDSDKNFLIIPLTAGTVMVSCTHRRTETVRQGLEDKTNE